MKTMKELIAAAREEAAEKRYLQQEEEREAARWRNIQEAEREIFWFKKEHARKKKVNVRISIRREYEPDWERYFYYLQFVVGGKVEKVYTLEEAAGISLTHGIEECEAHRATYFNLYDNHQLIKSK